MQQMDRESECGEQKGTSVVGGGASVAIQGIWWQGFRAKDEFSEELEGVSRLSRNQVWWEWSSMHGRRKRMGTRRWAVKLRHACGHL